MIRRERAICHRIRALGPFRLAIRASAGHQPGHHPRGDRAQGRERRAAARGERTAKYNWLIEIEAFAHLPYGLAG